MKAPFDDLQNVNELLRRRKNLHTIVELARYFNTDKSNVIHTLKYFDAYWNNKSEKNRKKTKSVETKTYDKDKINPGKNYNEYLKEQGIKPKMRYY